MFGKLRRHWRAIVGRPICDGWHEDLRFMGCEGSSLVAKCRACGQVLYTEIVFKPDPTKAFIGRAIAETTIHAD